MAERYLSTSSIGLLLDVMQEGDARPAVLIVRSALNRIGSAPQVYGVLRAKITGMRGDAPEQKGLWNILSSLMKAAPLVYVPLVRTDLSYLVENHLPWRFVSTNAVHSTQWCEDMVHSWEGLLPSAQWLSVFGAVRQFRSAALLHKERGERDSSGLDTSDDSTPFATPQQLKSLQAAMEELRGLVRRPAASGSTPHTSAAEEYSHVISALQEPPSWAPTGGDEDEYVPEGGSILLKNVAAPVQARAARKRQR
jgi:hypothetical protein